MISKSVNEQLFMQMFPHHGAQNNIAAALLEKFHLACVRAGIPSHFEPSNEITANELIQSITFDERVHAHPSTYLADGVV